MNVLLVEDDPSVRGAVERALRGAGHKVELATAGDRALAAATAIPYDAIVLDRGLPGLDGLEVCRRLRAVGNSVPILMLTARSAVSERVEGLDAGADDYVVKPFALDELLARLRAFERRSPAAGQARGELHFADLELDRDANSLDVYIGYLRRKLEQNGEPRLIHTVRGVGYVMKDAA